MYKFLQIHVTALKNPCINFDKYIQQQREIHVTTKFNKGTVGVTLQGKAMIRLRSDKKTKESGYK